MTKARIIADYAGTGATTDLATQAELNAVSTVASAALPKAGGTMTGDLVPVTQLSHRNVIINGNFDVWQRGSTFNSSTSTDHHSADRWKYYNYQQGSATQATRQAFTLGQTDVPGEPKFYLRHTMGSSQSEWWFFQRIEDVRTFAGQTATVSVWIKTSSAQTVRVRVDQYFGTGGSPSNTVYSSTQDFSVTTSWAKYTATFDVASLSGKTIGTDNNHYLALSFGSLGASGVVASSTVDFAQVQFEKGSSATPFEHRKFQDVVFDCQRYYVIHPQNGQAANLPAIQNSTSNHITTIDLPRPMRTTPSHSFGNNTNTFCKHDGYQSMASGVTWNVTYGDNTGIDENEHAMTQVSLGGGGLSGGDDMHVAVVYSSTSDFKWDAEL